MATLLNKLSRRAASVAATALLLLVLYVPNARAAFVPTETVSFSDLNPGDIRIFSITNLTVMGMEFDAVFNHATAFVDLPSPAITFSDAATAASARDALIRALHDALVFDIFKDTKFFTPPSPPPQDFTFEFQVPVEDAFSADPNAPFFTHIDARGSFAIFQPSPIFTPSNALVYGRLQGLNLGERNPVVLFRNTAIVTDRCAAMLNL